MLGQDERFKRAQNSVFVDGFKLSWHGSFIVVVAPEIEWVRVRLPRVRGRLWMPDFLKNAVGSRLAAGKSQCLILFESMLPVNGTASGFGRDLPADAASRRNWAHTAQL